MVPERPMLTMRRLFFADHFDEQAVPVLFKLVQAAAEVIHFAVNAAMFGAVSERKESLVSGLTIEPGGGERNAASLRSPDLRADLAH